MARLCSQPRLIAGHVGLVDGEFLPRIESFRVNGVRLTYFPLHALSPEHHTPSLSHGRQIPVPCSESCQSL